MANYFQSRVFKIGFWLFVLGSGPLLLTILAADLGLSSDPNPNPIGYGILCGITFWPALICMIVGIVQVRGRKQP